MEPRRVCSFCALPLPALCSPLYPLQHFCCADCQRCWHRRRGSHPADFEARAFGELLRRERTGLDAHEARVDRGNWYRIDIIVSG